jgi:hypothetical protein
LQFLDWKTDEPGTASANLAAPGGLLLSAGRVSFLSVRFHGQSVKPSQTSSRLFAPACSQLQLIAALAAACSDYSIFHFSL